MSDRSHAVLTVPAVLTVLTVLTVMSVLSARLAEAQDSCQRNGAGSCTAGNTVAISLNVTVTRAILMSLGSSAIILTAPGASEFDAGFGQTASPTLQIKSNAPFSVSLRSTQPLWSASPLPARANKPASDLQWAVAVGGPFTDMTTLGTTILTGAAGTAGTVIPLQFRVKYAWLLDTTGNYSLPLQLTLTSP